MTKFKPTKKRTSLVANEILEKHRYQLTLNGQKLLWGLAQSVDHTSGVWDEIEIDIQGVFDYLGVQDRKDRYRVVHDAFMDIAKNPLNVYINDRRWDIIPWASISFDESKSQYVKVAFDDKVKPFLIHLSGYVKIQGGYLSKLSSQYSTWLYPVMKMINEKYYGEHVIPISRLKQLTFTDDKKKHPSYNREPGGNSNFLSRCLGVIKDPKSGKFVILKDSPLAEISCKTDVEITAEVLKDGKKYDRVRFSVKRKVAPKSSNEVYGKLSKNVGVTRVPMKNIYGYAKVLNITAKEYCDQLGYEIKGDYAVQYYKKKKNNSDQLNLGALFTKGSGGRQS